MSNGYLERQKASRQAILDMGEQLGTQKMWDYVQMVLTDPEVMKNKTFSRKGIETLFAKVHELADIYHVAFTDDVEADYYQEKMDAQLREKWGEDLAPFYERYPMIKRLGYDKAMKGWK
jgi:hypothetical protein